MAPLPCFFASDLHGRLDRYDKLVDRVVEERPRAVFLGGDLLPFERCWSGVDFLGEELMPRMRRIRELSSRVFLILGNDDPRDREAALVDADLRGELDYMHGRWKAISGYQVFGYSFVPPTPFLIKDWERYDVSRYVDPGCVSPEEGHRTVPVPAAEIRSRTIELDLQRMAADRRLDNSVILFHSPPYQTRLDRAALDGRMVDNVPLDVHVGSVAIRRFIEHHRPLLTLHGHIHESQRITGSWRDQIGRTEMFNAAHDGPELALIRFDLHDLGGATRELI